MKLKIGTRGSKLALYQANLVKDKIKQLFGGKNKKIDIEIKTIKTSGDKILTASLSSFGGKGLFVKEIEEALFNEDIDIAVHSLKDVPQAIPEELTLGAVLKRDDPRDCIILKDKPESSGGFDSVNFASLLKSRAIVGTSSLRRRALLARLRDDIIFEPLRGNIDTRLKKLRDGFFDAIVLSSSGLIRLNLSSCIDVYLDPFKFIPQCGQGAIALEYKGSRADIGEIIKPLNDEDTKFSVFAERACIKGLGCGCASPVGAYSHIEGDNLHIKGFVSNLHGEYLEDEAAGKKTDYENIGKSLSLNLINKGGLEILNKNNDFCDNKKEI
ncbi:MAG: hydroxymethylbilane synthase [Deltaproteobacteria bacterium]|nr:hydroxymethylbilane synthase [Deltaproteobacteria bacterium]MCL5879976.1 hydroxymethylbilane synthase [Deltaproteobacteria bacterium]MDA8304378.1 hydroxymethylbilane synthase [Deltaproteobacteria bacterium]